jgi:hypothetical protein
LKAIERRWGEGVPPDSIGRFVRNHLPGYRRYRSSADLDGDIIQID